MACILDETRNPSKGARCERKEREFSLQSGLEAIKMNEQPNWVFGIRCSEDAYNNLWIGKAGNISFTSVFPKELEERIKEKLRELRKSRTGAFWINPDNKTLTAVSEDSADNSQYPQTTY